jgi:hypothetical protein
MGSLPRFRSPIVKRYDVGGTLAHGLNSQLQLTALNAAHHGQCNAYALHEFKCAF